MRAASVVLAVSSLLATSCSTRDPEGAANGVARLTAATVAAIADLVARDTKCGFASDAVVKAVVLDGTPGGEGRAVYSVDRCLLDLDANASTSTSCDGVIRTLRGKLTVTGTLMIRGNLTGSAETPAVPDGPNGLTIELSRVEVDELSMELSNRFEKLTMRNGAFSATVEPRMAAAEGLGTCAIATPNVRLDHIQYNNANVFLERGEDVSAYLFIPTSDLNARIGRTDDGENTISGRLNFFTREFILPSAASKAKFDPAYDAAAFERSFACTEGLAQPVSYDCELRNEDLGTAIARLTVTNLAAMSALLERDSACGFASPNVLASAEIVGEAGHPGLVKLETRGCTLDVPAGTVVQEDCLGSETTAGGRVTIDATRTIAGRLTGDPTRPIIPGADDAVSVVIRQARFDNFQVESQLAGAGLGQVSGTITATIVPRIAARASDGSCTVPTPNAHIRGIRYDGAIVRVDSSTTSLAVTVDGSDLEAVIGEAAGQTNRLQGELSVAGVGYVLDGSEGLFPGFDLGEFRRRWECASELAKPISYSCDPLPRIVDGAARLTINTLGVVTALIERDERCGFSSAAVAGAPALMGATGQKGAATFTIATPCSVHFAAPSLVSTDCNGVQTHARGTVSVRGSKTLRGYLTGDPSLPVVPASGAPIDYQLEATFEDFEVTVPTSTSALTVESGMLAAKVAPRTALDGATGACSIPISDASFQDVVYADASLQLETSGFVFGLAVRTSDLEAVSGEKDGRSNLIEGTISAEGSDWTVPADPGTGGLDPSYDARTFPDRYACLPGIVLPSRDSDCSFRRTLAENAARLTIKALATVADLIASDPQCGLIVGMGTAANCPIVRIGPAAAVPFRDDCLRNQTFASGRATISARLDPMGIIISSAVLSEFSAFTKPAVDPFPRASLLFHTGTVSGLVTPVRGQRRSTGAFDVPTPVAGFSNVGVQQATATLALAGRTFDVAIPSAMLEGFNGAFMGRVNFVRGRISVDGTEVLLADVPLDPEYRQSAFDLGYDCDPELRAPIPP